MTPAHDSLEFFQQQRITCGLGTNNVQSVEINYVSLQIKSQCDCGNRLHLYNACCTAGRQQINHNMGQLLQRRVAAVSFNNKCHLSQMSSLLNGSLNGTEENTLLSPTVLFSNLLF